MIRLLLPFFFLFLLLPFSVSAFYSSKICTSDTDSSPTCTKGEVGVFMEGISSACGNTGDCTLNDIMLLFVNTGNYVVGLIGAIVLLMYVVGGFLFLTSAGSTERVTKGKKYLSISTIGLLIVMFSYLGILALRSALKTGDVTSVPYVVCSGPNDAKKPCDVNATCDETGYVCTY
ncbi:MAG: hypothetical protein WC654_04685 [Patescibacteria group bacterium]